MARTGERKMGRKAARHLDFEDGFTFVVTHDNFLVGLISIQQRLLPIPLTANLESYIDIIEVDDGFRMVFRSWLSKERNCQPVGKTKL